jgi:hypothetical protein
MENQNQEEHGIQIIESTGVDVFEAQERAAIDIQIATAKKYPRDLMRVKNNSIAIVSMDMETAQSCRYAKPVAGGKISGPSVHLARIICQQYGNIRVQQRIKQITRTEIVAEAVAFDLETNYAVSVEARRNIIGKNGSRFADSVVETNAMATLAIAERNAILKVVPKALTDTVYKAAFNFANGDLSDEQKILTARKKMLDFFAEKYEAKEADILRLLGLRSIGQIKSDQIADLRAFAQSLKDGEVTATELFGKNKIEETPQALKVETPKPTEGKLL